MPARSLALSIVLGLVALAPACTQSRASTIPAEGLTLRHAWTPGARFEAEVLHREQGEGVERRSSFHVTRVVTTIDESGKALVDASVSRIRLDWTQPDRASEAEAAARRLEGANIRFFVDARGQALDVPTPPPELDESTAHALEILIAGATSGCQPLPDRPLRRHASWTTVEGEGLARHTFVGLVEAQPERRLARIDSAAAVTSQRARTSVAVIFDVDGGFVTEVWSTTSLGRLPSSQVDWKATWRVADDVAEVGSPTGSPLGARCPEAPRRRRCLRHLIEGRL
ncbi:hypothetical protein ACNOYE_37805 [Nannocystaceae bacterium ST9]